MEPVPQSLVSSRASAAATSFGLSRFWRCNQSKVTRATEPCWGNKSPEWLDYLDSYSITIFIDFRFRVVLSPIRWPLKYPLSAVATNKPSWEYIMCGDYIKLCLNHQHPRVLKQTNPIHPSLIHTHTNPITHLTQHIIHMIRITAAHHFQGMNFFCVLWIVYFFF